MSGFTTEALLYPLTKGDTPGHPFHGNQYKDVASEGKTSSPRPPKGQFQLNQDEVNEIASVYRKVCGDIQPGSRDYQTRLEEAKDAAAVRLSQMLGMDKPAIRVDSKDMTTNPDLYRGCSLKGADSLTRELVHYGMGGGIAYGSGVYTAPDSKTALRYGGDAQVEIWLDPNANILHEENLLKLPVAPEFATSNRDFGSAIGNPSTLALAWGYQAYAAGDDPGPRAVVILDRSIMKIAY